MLYVVMVDNIRRAVMEKKDIYVSKFHRKVPIKEFDTRQTLYSLVVNENRNNLQTAAIGYLGYDITYGQLFESVDRLADAYIKSGIKSLFGRLDIRH